MAGRRRWKRRLQTVGRLDELHEQVGRDKNQHLEQMRRAAHLQNEAVASKAHVDNLHRERQRLRHRFEQTAENLAVIDGELRDLSLADESLQSRLAAARQALDNKRHERDRLRSATTPRAISALRQSAAASRAVSKFWKVSSAATKAWAPGSARSSR